jgi:hypothetical protein
LNHLVCIAAKIIADHVKGDCSNGNVTSYDEIVGLIYKLYSYSIQEGIGAIAP